MYKEKIVVPIGVTYVGETFEGRRLWEEYNLENYNFPHILNKVLTGCGYTEYCLTNDQDLVLISPRKFLLENKLAQHLSDLNIHYAENRTDVVVNYEKNIKLEDRKESSTNAVKIEAAMALKRESIETLKRKVVEHVMMCRRMGKPVKILVTYDSFRHVREALGDQIKNFQIVIDEFQSIFIDARFKSDAELELLYQLQDLQKVCFVSATPMLDKYLELLDEFKGLPYYEFDWGAEDPRRVVKPKLEIKFSSRSLNFWISRIIQQEYLSGNFEKTTLKDIHSSYLYNTYISKEAVFFLNSVTGICKAITTNLLSIDQCNILCAKTDENNKQVRDAFNLVIKKKAEQEGISKPEFLKGNVIGEIPTRGQQHKMFTFCTRTVYLGADFYSECARTFIFSDANIECLSVDISMDLEQILGRQRLKENPWKNRATMFIKTTRGTNKVPWEEFKERLDEKERKTISLLDAYRTASGKHDLAENYQKVAKTYHYKDDYVAVNEHAGSDLVPVFNKLMQVSEIRAFEMQQTDYADRFTVFNAVADKGLTGDTETVKELAEEFKGLTDEVTRLRFIVSLGEKDLTKEELFSFFSLFSDKYFNYYDILGFDGIKACKCQESYIKRKIDDIKGNSMIGRDVKEEIYRLFQIGKRYVNKDIKQSLKLLYERLGYQKTAKANDLEEYFEIKTVKFQDLSGKWVHGLELLSKK